MNKLNLSFENAINRTLTSHFTLEGSPVSPSKRRQVQKVPVE